MAVKLYTSVLLLMFFSETMSNCVFQLQPQTVYFKKLHDNSDCVKSMCESPPTVKYQVFDEGRADHATSGAHAETMVAAETCGGEKETCNHGCCMFNTRCCTQLEWKLWVHGIVPLVILGVVLLVVVACTLIAFLTPAPHGRVTGFSRFVTKGPPPPTSVGTIDYW